MLIEEVIFAALNAQPLLSMLAIRPNVAQATDSAPYVIYSQITGGRVKSLLGDSGLTNPHFQFDVYAPDPLTAANLKIAVRQALLGSSVLGAIHLDEASSYEADTKLFRARQDYSFWFNDQ